MPTRRQADRPLPPPPVDPKRATVADHHMRIDAEQPAWQESVDTGTNRDHARQLAT